MPPAIIMPPTPVPVVLPPPPLLAVVPEPPHATHREASIGKRPSKLRRTSHVFRKIMQATLSRLFEAAAFRLSWRSNPGRARSVAESCRSCGSATSDVVDLELRSSICAVCGVSSRYSFTISIPRWPEEILRRAREEAGRLGEEAGSPGEEAGRLGDDAGRLGEEARSLGEEAGSLGDDAGRLGEEAGSLGGQLEVRENGHDHLALGDVTDDGAGSDRHLDSVNP
jgi:hypothetical protein